MSKVKFLVLVISISFFTILSCGKGDPKQLRAEIKKVDAKINELKESSKLLQSRLRDAKGQVKDDIERKIQDFQKRIDKKMAKKKELKDKIRKLMTRGK